MFQAIFPYGPIYGVFFHIRGETPEDLVHPERQKAVGLIIRGDYYSLGTGPARFREAHAGFDPLCLCLIACSSNNPAFPPGNYGFALQFRVDCLFAGRKKGISVNMKDGPWP
jgi:hypothetical protein